LLSDLLYHRFLGDLLYRRLLCRSLFNRSFLRGYFLYRLLGHVANLMPKRARLPISPRSIFYIAMNYT
ncbi:MAG: hypothetical protein RL602_727, partial [Actinomycetota bacterium]